MRPHATIEELLRKLPGVEVDADGNVTMQGKKVEKVYIDGKEFFLNDLRNATRNLPADIVSQVELFDAQSDQARLSGIKGISRSKAINIKLKKKNFIFRKLEERLFYFLKKILGRHLKIV